MGLLINLYLIKEVNFEFCFKENCFKIGLFFFLHIVAPVWNFIQNLFIFRTTRNLYIQITGQYALSNHMVTK